MRKKEESPRIRIASPLLYLLHCMIGIIICLILSLVFSFLMAFEKLPASSIALVSCISVFAGSCISSVLSAKKFGKILLSSLLQGIIFFGFLFILGTVIFSRLIPESIPPHIPVSCLVGSLSGAFLTALFKRHRH